MPDIGALRRRAIICLMGIGLAPISCMAETLIGVAAPLTGRFAEQGKTIASNVETAVQAINAQGGVLGEKLRVVAIDDACEANAGREAARHLVALQPAVVIGHNCGSAAIAAAPIYAQAGAVMLALTRHPAFTDKRAGPTIFRMAGRDDRQGSAIAQHILATARDKRVAIVHDRTQYGRSVGEDTQRALIAAGMPPILIEGIVAGEKDYAGVIGRLRQTNTDIIVFGGFPSEADIILRQARASGSSASLIGGDALAENFGALAGPIGDGTRVVAPVAPVARLNEEALAAVASWHAATTASGTLAASDVSRALMRPTANASITAFDSRGDAMLPSYEIRVWQKGRLERP